MTATVGMRRVAQDVPAHHLAGRQALHGRGPGVVGLEDLDRAGPRHPGDVAEVHDHHGQRRHEQVAGSGSRMSASGGGVASTGSSPAGRRRRRRGSCRTRTPGSTTWSRRAARSRGRPAGRAAARRQSPAAMASGIVMSSARPASLADRTNAAASCGRTGWPLTNESPKSNVTTLDQRVDVLHDQRSVRARAAR